MEFYKIEIQGKLDVSWKEWFPGMEFHYSSDGKTKIAGHIHDQTALHGMINRIRDLGIPLLKVERLPKRSNPENT